ncbi:MAG: ABC transporter permease [Clostridiales bacterium]|nr:ABC transporter permease [Clostridiales bacterium]
MLADFTKMEFYRLFKMKSTYICLIAFLVVSILYNGLFMSVRFSKFGINVDNYQQAVSADISGYVEEDFSVNSVVENKTDLQADDQPLIGRGLGDYGKARVEDLFCFTMSKLNSLLCLGIVAAFLYGEDYSRKAIKNYNRINLSRHIRLLSKTAVLAVYAAAYHIVTYLASFISFIMFGTKSMSDGMKITNTGGFLLYILMTYLLTLAFISLVMTATVITRNQIAGLVIAIFMSMGTLSILFQAVDIILLHLTGSRFPFNFGMLSVTYDLSTADHYMLLSSNKVAAIILIAVIYLISCIFASILSIKRKDYK